MQPLASIRTADAILPLLGLATVALRGGTLAVAFGQPPLWPMGSHHPSRCGVRDKYQEELGSGHDGGAFWDGESSLACTEFDDTPNLQPGDLRKVQPGLGCVLATIWGMRVLVRILKGIVEWGIVSFCGHLISFKG
ncbi:hypothetical protein PG994_004181 [Apiospora phragmitis]|uniref:Uncharacterized protein n=1 Tax=Apiospora phragmitis TaxID=2905665 RepID=A0ABR1VR07_9PEZI